MAPFADVSADGTHIQNTKALVETAYNNTNGTRVYLVGHSNGPVYALGLLTSQTAAWRDKYVGKMLFNDAALFSVTNPRHSPAGLLVNCKIVAVLLSPSC